MRGLQNVILDEYIGPIECDTMNYSVRYRGHTDMVSLEFPSHRCMSRLRIALRLVRILVRMLT